jgi:predicted SnoaL-like aldol condensation-catalyzing enzyme
MRKTVVALLALSCLPMLAQSGAAQEEKNTQMALSWWREVVTFGHVELGPKYMAEDYIEHNPNIGDNRAAFVAYFGKTPARPIQSALPKQPVKAFGKNDYVVLVWEHDDKDQTGKAIKYNTYDILRIQNGKIQEHWDGEKKNP